MGIKRGYLNCYQRTQAQTLWRDKLTVAGYFDALPREWVLVDEALGRVTASSVYANQSVPHYNGSAMDGIAVRAADTFGAQETAPLRLTVLPTGSPCSAGECTVVDTGDPLPEGTNAVIMIEDVHMESGQAEILAAATPWQHVRIIGEDIVANELIIPEHHTILPADIAAMLAAGLEEVEVLRRPKVAVIPTGSELVASVRELVPGAILDVNSHMLAAAISEWKGIPDRRPIVRDEYFAIKQVVLDCLEHSDMVILNAGTSAGTEDFTAKILQELGEVLVHGVAIKPGKPVVLAICQGKPVIGLPGYPVSAMLTAELFVRGILLSRQKLPQPEDKSVEAALVRQLPSSVGVEEYIRVTVGRVNGKLVAAPLGRGAGLISSLTKAQGLLAVDEASPGLNAGAVVPIKVLNNSLPLDNVLAVGSHDLALDVLGVYLRRKAENVALSCANVGSMGGIQAIRNGEAHLAGIHLLDPETGCYNLSYVRRYLAQRRWRLVHLAMREQGLMVPPGNPRGITGLSGLAGADITFVNRQRGSGTRMLLDYELGKMGLDGSQIAGYDKEVATHMAVAATVAAGVADAGLGIYAAAAALGLEFIPVAQEQYDLILNFPDEDERLGLIIDILQTTEFRRQIESLGGYDLKDAGWQIAAWDSEEA